VQEDKCNFILLYMYYMIIHSVNKNYTVQTKVKFFNSYSPEELLWHVKSLD